MSEIFSDAITPVVESRNNGILCYSTEELLEVLESFNNCKENPSNQNLPRRVVGSMDAISLYPSLEVERSAEIIKEEVMKSDVIFDNIDNHELGIYLKKNLSDEYIHMNKYENLLPTKVKGEDEDDYEHENVDDILTLKMFLMKNLSHKKA